jgi:rhodanese-related sulfurtransferase
MKRKTVFKLALLLCLASQNTISYAQNQENWNKEQLVQPADLAKIIQTGKDIPVIFCVGPGAYIANSINIGATNEKANIDKLKEELKKLPKDARIVLYCGCCPFAHCPNVRPAIQLLKEMKFTNYRLLNLEHNIKMDWIDKGYPVMK